MYEKVGDAFLNELYMTKIGVCNHDTNPKVISGKKRAFCGQNRYISVFFGHKKNTKKLVFCKFFCTVLNKKRQGLVFDLQKLIKFFLFSF